MAEPICIAIDGPVASGKTVVGRLVARRLGFRFLDTGAMYRAVTWLAARRGTDLGDEAALSRLASSVTMRVMGSGGRDRLWVDEEDVTDHLREPEVDHGVSLVARVSGVRSALVAQQRAIASEGHIVMVGRDIGTVVLPDAPVKLFLTAPIEVRSGRRFEEFRRAGDDASYERVADELRRRDKIDSERADSPLRPADDAVVIETDVLGVAEVARSVLSLIESRRLRPDRR